MRMCADRAVNAVGPAVDHGCRSTAGQPTTAAPQLAAALNLPLRLARAPAATDLRRYGMDRRDGKDLAQLLRELAKLEGLRWIRLLCESGWAVGGPVVWAVGRPVVWAVGGPAVPHALASSCETRGGLLKARFDLMTATCLPPALQTATLRTSARPWLTRLPATPRQGVLRGGVQQGGLCITADRARGGCA